MNSTLRNGLLATTALAGVAFAAPANASLALFQTFSAPGEATSTDGCGSLSATCSMHNTIPVGATIDGAWLYSSTFNPATNPNGTTLAAGGPAIVPVFTPLGAQNGLQAWRANVSAFVTANAAAATWTVNEGAQTAAIDGESLVISYHTGVGPVRTAIILDGFSSSAGDNAMVTFAPLAAGFTAEMRIGDGFSFDGTNPNAPTNTLQVSTITVNGNLLTSVAGHCDDAVDTSCANGNLITTGAFNAGADDDPFTPAACTGLPCIGLDHERYNLQNVLNVGDSSALIHTVNPSNNDNIYLEVFDFAGVAVVQTPEPASLGLLGAALAGFGLFGRRRRWRS
jgi:hypothetical protein